MTAVEYLLKKFPLGLTWTMAEEIREAKEQEKKDIISAYAFGHNDGCRYMINNKQEFEHGEEYYQKNFKQK